MTDQATLAAVAAHLDRLAEALPAPPDGLAARTLARARHETGLARREAMPWPGLFRRPALAGLAAAVALALVLAIQTGTHRVAPAPSEPPARRAAEPARKETRIMMAADQAEAWATVFTGSSDAARQAVARLAAQGIAARSEPAGAALTRVMVQSADSGRAEQLLRPAVDVQD